MLNARIIVILLSLIFALPLSSTYADESNKSYLLLNDDKIISGEIITFTNGFLYFKQTDIILKISPAHFKGVFNTQQAALRAITILNNLSTISGRQDQKSLTSTYKAADTLINNVATDEDIDRLFTEVQEELTEPRKILDAKLYKKLALLSAVSRYYNLDQHLRELIEEYTNEKSLKDLPEAAQKDIKSQKETLYYLIEHPYIKK